MAGERLTSTGLVPLHSPSAANREFPERTDAAVTSDTPLQQLLRAVVRFWWVALLGIVLAGLAFTFATYRVTTGFPPKLESRSHSTYSASTQLLITSKGEPYLSSTNVNAKIIKLPDSTTASTTGTATGTQQNSTYDSGSGADGDLQRLVEIANSLPPRVTSDTVIRLRNRLYGRIAGTVTAVNPYAFSGAGGFREGPLPFIKITGTADTPQDATDITNQTAQAFKAWFEGRQKVDKIKNPVIVEQVNSAGTAFANGGSKPLLGVAAALLVLLGGAGLVLALDRLIPRRRPSPARTAVAAAPERELTAAEHELTPSEPAMPALEVPTMTLAAKVEDVVPGDQTKRARRPRKPAATNGNGNGNGHGDSTAPRRRRPPTTAAPVAPKTEDAG
jgi:hypothetical protein